MRYAKSDKIHQSRKWLVAGAEYFSCGLSLLFARAETYIAGQVGYTLAQDTTNGKATEPVFAGLPSGTSVSNVTPNESLMYGMKLGHYLKSPPWLGIELESFITTLQRPQQRLTLGVPGLGAFQYDEGGAINQQSGLPAKDHLILRSPAFRRFLLLPRVYARVLPLFEDERDSSPA